MPAPLARRLDPALLSVELDERDALEQLPGKGLGQERAGLAGILAHHEPHLGRLATSARTTHALQEGRDGEGRIHLEGTLEPPDVDTKLEGRRRAGGERHLLIAHQLLGRLAKAR